MTMNLSMIYLVEDNRLRNGRGKHDACNGKSLEGRRSTMLRNAVRAGTLVIGDVRE